MGRTRTLFTLFVLLLAGQRLLELRLSRRNERALQAQGASEYGAEQFRWMRLLHSAWFASMLAELFLLKRPFRPRLAGVAAVLTALGQAFRYVAIRTLGSRWTVRIFVLPGSKPVSGGIYRYLRHPNYLGVMLEIAAVPLLHSAYLTSIVFSLANALLLRARIRAEEAALMRAGGYRLLSGRPRFILRLQR